MVVEGADVKLEPLDSTEAKVDTDMLEIDPPDGSVDCELGVGPPLDSVETPGCDVPCAVEDTIPVFDNETVGDIRVCELEKLLIVVEIVFPEGVETDSGDAGLTVELDGP